ncbi:hypothetical protein BGZ90_006306 [Linnemannia elongata]|nr:hypothetical protein BGZ90_006306 [Linnemannia elongata]
MDEFVQVWRVSSDSEDVVVKLLWGTHRTTGIGLTEQKMLLQCGAIDDSLTLEEYERSDIEE